MSTIPALQIDVEAPICSFRDPMYSGVQIGLPVPPPSTVGGLLAACAGGWNHTPLDTSFAMTFHAQGTGEDLETYWPVDRNGQTTKADAKPRPFLAGCHLTLWILNELDYWEHATRNPVYPTVLGRSQDLASIEAQRITLTAEPGHQGTALLPADTPGAVGDPRHLATAVSENRQYTTWDTYRWTERHSTHPLRTGHRTDNGQAVIPLPPVHPATAAAHPAATL